MKYAKVPNLKPSDLVVANLPKSATLGFTFFFFKHREKNLFSEVKTGSQNWKRVLPHACPRG